MEFTRDASDLFHAVLSGSTDEVLKVIQSVEDVNVLNDLDQTPLIVSIIMNSENSLDVVSLLVDKGAKLNVADHHGMTALMYAIEECKTNVAKLLIRNGCDVDIKNIVNQTALHLAIQQDLTELVLPLIKGNSDIDIQDDTQLLTSVNKRVNILNSKGQSVLVVSVLVRNEDIAMLLINHGADVNQPDLNGTTPLMYAIIGKGCDVNLQNKNRISALHFAVDQVNTDLVKLLLQNGASVNATNYRRQTPFVLSLLVRNEDIAMLLIDHGADVNQPDLNGTTPLMYAIQKTLFNMVKLMISKGCDVNLQNKNRISALHFAVDQVNTDLVKLLLQNGASVNATNYRRQTPFMLAIREWKGCSERAVSLQRQTEQIINLLLESSPDLNLQDENGYTCLMMSVERGLFNLSIIFINKECDINLQNKRQQTAVHLNSYYESPCPITRDARTKYDCLKTLLKSGADLNIQDFQGVTPLLASIYNFCSGTQLLIEKGADLNIADFKGETPLLLSIYMRNGEVAKLLIEKGADLNIADFKGKNPLMRAIRMNLIDVAELLEKKGCKVNSQDGESNSQEPEKETPLLLSILSGNSEAAMMLIENGADINVSNSNGKTPLMTAIEKDENDVAVALIKKGCDLHAQDKDKKNALHLAARKGTISVIDCLIQHGFNINIKDRDDQSPLKISIQEKHEEVAMLLIENGADINDASIQGDSVLLSAIHIPLNNVALKLIHKGCDISQRTRGITALRVAVVCGLIEVVDALLENGAYCNSVDDYGHTLIAISLDFLCRYGNCDIAKCIALLVKKGVDVDIRYEDGGTLLMKCIDRNCIMVKEIAEMFLQKGCDVNVVVGKYKNKTALSFAIESNNNDLVQLLLKYGANPNIGGDYLKYCSYVGHKRCVISVIKHGLRSDLLPEHFRYPGVLCHFLMMANSEIYQRHKSFLELLFLTGSCRQSTLFTLLKDPNYVARFDKNPEVLKWIESKSCSPMSLKNISRIRISAHVQPNKAKNIKEIGLPLILQQFLMFDDIMDDDKYDDDDDY